MKLPSPRTWLLVLGAGLLLAGVVVVYVVKNPPLPPDWQEYDCDRFRVALPPTGLGPHNLPPLEVSPHGTYGITYFPSWEDSTIEFEGMETSGRKSLTTPDELLEDRVQELTTDVLPWKVIATSCERIQFRGYPARRLDVSVQYEASSPMKWRYLIVLADGWLHTVTVRCGPNAATEEDAGLVFRTFRPK